MPYRCCKNVSFYWREMGNHEKVLSKGMTWSDVFKRFAQVVLRIDWVGGSGERWSDR